MAEHDSRRGDRTEESEDEQARIARRAYERFEERGGRHGDDQADWYEAEREVRMRAGGREAADAELGREEHVTSGRATRGRGTRGAALDEDLARASGTGPTSSPTGTGPGGNVRTPGTAVSGGPTEGGR